MDLGDQGRGLLLVEARDHAGCGIHRVTVHRQLDKVHAVLDLAANLLDPFGDVAHQHTDGGFGHANPSRIPVIQPLARGERALSC